VTEVLDQLRLRADAVSGVLVILGLLWFSRRWAKQRGIAPAIFDEVVWTGTIVALAAGRAAWVLTEAPQLYRYPFDLIRVQSGVDLPAVVVSFALVAWWSSRKGPVATAEFAGLALLLAAAAWAALCLFRSDCYGRAGPYPFAVPFAQFSEPRLPIGIYEAILLAAAAPLLLSLRLRPVAFLCASVAAFALTQFVVEFGRVGGISRFTDSWRWGWLLLAAAAATLVLLEVRGNPTKVKVGASPIPSDDPQ
jgi:prolipoprotein diacylglyceryltransferase